MPGKRATIVMVTEQTRNPDGSVTIRPVEVADEREIGAMEAAKILGFRDRESVYRLIDLGELRAWKPASRRGNGKWRINLQSVIQYRDRLYEAGA